MSRILIVGGGMMGSGIAAVALYAGNKVDIIEPNKGAAETLAGRIDHITEELLKNEMISEKQAQNAGNFEHFSSLEEYFGQPDLVIEAISEMLELKQKLFVQLDDKFDAGIPLTSNTSGLRITDIAKDIVHKERAMTTHFWFPAHLVPLVEVVMSDWTDRGLAENVCDILKGWGKAPVLVKKDLPGQLANRIFQAVIREATSIVENGIAEPEDVDTAIKMGMGLRFPVWGPLEHVDAVGLVLCESVQNHVLPSISAAQEAADIFREKLQKGDTGYGSGKGFYDWNEKSMEQLEQLRNQFLMQSVKFLRTYQK